MFANLMQIAVLGRALKILLNLARKLFVMITENAIPDQLRIQLNALILNVLIVLVSPFVIKFLAKYKTEFLLVFTPKLIAMMEKIVLMITATLPLANVCQTR
jgi:hypothetical protein